MKGFGMGNPPPRVSIGLPVYNGERHLGYALDSLLGQTFTDFELIISDNTSTDCTEEICMAYAATDRRIRYYRNEANLGATRNYNRTVGLATGTYFMWASHDDVWEPRFIERCVAALDAMPGIVLAHTRTSVIDDHGDHVRDYDATFKTDSAHAHVRFHDLLRTPHEWYQPFGLIRASALARTPLYGTYSGTDFVLMAHLSLIGPFFEVPEILYRNRQHAWQLSKLDRYTRMAGYDLTQNPHTALPHWRLFFGLWAAVWRVPLPLPDRLRCCLTMLSYPAWNRNWGRLAKDVLRASLHVLRTTLPRARRSRLRKNANDLRA